MDYPVKSLECDDGADVIHWFVPLLEKIFEIFYDLCAYFHFTIFSSSWLLVQMHIDEQ